MEHLQPLYLWKVAQSGHTDRHRHRSFNFISIISKQTFVSSRTQLKFVQHVFKICNAIAIAIFDDVDADASSANAAAFKVDASVARLADF